MASEPEDSRPEETEPGKGGPRDEETPVVTQPPEEEEEEGGPVKTFLEHLEDLRWVIIKAGSALVVGLAACLAGAPQIIKFLTWPLVNSGAKVQLQFFGPLGGFVISMKIALYGGITLALPFILYFVGSFVMPALKRNEKTFFLRAFIIGAGLFLLGVMICYFWILGITLKATTQFNEWLGLPTDYWRAEEYFQFVTLFMMGMGLSFELPIVVLALVKIGLVQHSWLTKGRPYFYLALFAVVSFITPDFVSTFFIMIPLVVLMEICILISWFWERQKRAAERARPR
jgi:sec-independent protein translocase protein TatC